MLALKGKQDGFRFLFPDDFLAEEIVEKYAKILKARHSFITKPIDFINESIQNIQVLGFNEGVMFQEQPGIGSPVRKPERVQQNAFLHTATEFAFRSDLNPLQLLDKTLNVYFRHTLGYLNYFMLFENFWYQYSRDTEYKEMCKQFSVDITNEKGSIYSRIFINGPLMNSMDMLDLNYTQPITAPQNFKLEFKYSDIDFAFIDETGKVIE